MKRACGQFRERLIAVAFGGADEEAEAHARSCPDCARHLAELQAVQRAASALTLDAPADLIVAAKAIAAGARAPSPCKRISSTLAAAGVRAGDAAAFQELIEAGGERLRVEYRREESGWSVMLRLPTEGWEVFAVDSVCEPDADGYVTFTSPDLPGTAFVILSPDGAHSVGPPGGGSSDN